MGSFKVEILETQGVKWAMMAMRLSWRSGSKGDTAENIPGPNDDELAKRLLAIRDDHGKYARQIVSWLDVTMPRYWWHEMATYRIGAEWASESTMHTLEKDLDKGRASFASGVHPDTTKTILEAPEGASLTYLKANLPEGFYQRRIGMVSLQTLRRIYQQRNEHELNEWRYFCRVLETQHPLADYITMSSRAELEMQGLREELDRVKAKLSQKEHSDE